MSKRAIGRIILILTLLFIYSCDNRIGKPDIRKEQIKGNKLDYFGWKWNFKW